MLIAEKCANRSSPPPSGVMNPKPFASLNHFTVPVAIVGNSLSTTIKRDVARPMFRSQGKYGGRTTAWRSYRACFTAWNKTRQALYATFPGKAKDVARLGAANIRPRRVTTIGLFGPFSL